jgi:hypothetical protein
VKKTVDKDALEDLYWCIERNTALIRGHLYDNIHNDELVAFLIVKLDEIQFFMGKVYNLELNQLKEQARTYYQSWLHLKDTYPETAASVYVQYLECKNRIKEMECPF